MQDTRPDDEANSVNFGQWQLRPFNPELITILDDNGNGQVLGQAETIKSELPLDLAINIQAALERELQTLTEDQIRRILMSRTNPIDNRTLFHIAWATLALNDAGSTKHLKIRPRYTNKLIYTKSDYWRDYIDTLHDYDLKSESILLNPRSIKFSIDVQKPSVGVNVPIKYVGSWLFLFFSSLLVVNVLTDARYVDPLVGLIGLISSLSFWIMGHIKK
jgi:hypothetical protein